MMATNDSVVVVGLLAISANDGALVHPFCFCGPTAWQRLQDGLGELAAICHIFRAND